MLYVSIGLFLRAQENRLQVWLQRRTDSGPFNGFWEFPGGKIEESETPKEAVVREIQEEVGLESTLDDWRDFQVFFHTYQREEGDKKILFYCFVSLTNPDECASEKNLETQWVDVSGLVDIKLPPANLEIHKTLVDLENDLLKEVNEKQTLDERLKRLWNLFSND